PTFRPILTLAQHLCASVPERAEARVRVAGGLASVLLELARDVQGMFVSFLSKFSRSPRLPHRGFAVEMACCLICQDWPWETPGAAPGQ
ncbi:unnamed protein product, partial [Discosporangium mesarthrocarpum]